MARSAILRHSVRLHDTNEPEAIGQAVSRGCFRLFSQDIIDL
jgi:lipoprotein-anchoring transpeptidase ErfK/SrfK